MNIVRIYFAPERYVDYDELLWAIREGKRHGYLSGEKAKIDPQDPTGTLKYYEWEHGDWFYRDEYRGSYMAPGRELLRYKMRPLWQMAYAGGIIDPFCFVPEIKDPTFDLLIAALQQMPDNFPIRGPHGFVARDKGDYVCNWEGDNITLLTGTESIHLDGDYIRGLLPPSSTLDISDNPLTFRQHFCASTIIYKD